MTIQCLNGIANEKMAIECLIMKIKMQLSNENAICKWKCNVDNENENAIGKWKFNWQITIQCSISCYSMFNLACQLAMQYANCKSIFNY